MVIGISGSLILSKTLMQLIFNPCCEFRWSSEGPVSQIQSPHLHDGASEIYWDLLRSVQMLKREWGAKATGSYRTYLFLVNLQPWLLSLQWKTCLWKRTITLVPEFAVKDLRLEKNYNLGSWVCSERSAYGKELQPWFLSLQWRTCLWKRTITVVPAFAVKDLPLEKNYNLGSWVCSERPASGKEL